MAKNKRLAILVATAMVATVAGFVFTLGASAAPGEIRLHLGSDGRFFQYGSTTQNLTTQSNNCKINSPQPVMALTSTGSQSAPGLVGDAIGVKGSPNSGNGTPCSQVDSTESLTFRAGTSLTGRTFTGVRLDLEMTGNAIVKLTFANATQSAIYELQTGTSITSDQSSEPGYDMTVPYTVSSGPGDTVDACAAPNSSGPNSGPNDNCEWTVQAGFNASSITVTTVSAGSVAVEGSNDFGNDANFDSLFFLSNSPPVANTDTVTTNEDTAVSGNVLTNDSDPDGNPLTASKVSNPAHGSASVSADGSFTYTPAADYHGSDSFTYLASDGTDGTQGTVNITVTPVNDPPVAQGGTVSTDEDTAVTITVATDVDSSVIHVSCTGAQGGTVVDNGDGTVTFTPPANFNGTITLICTATDDQGASSTSSATVVVGVSPVNDAPVAGNDTAEVDQNTSTAVAVLGNDTDIDSATLTPVDIGNVSPLGATATANVDGTVQFTPPTGYAGSASFTYQASDGQLASNTATVSITVFPVICSNETVSTSSGSVEGSFTRLTDSFECKRYALASSSTDGTVLFVPNGVQQVDYRGFVSFGADPAPSPSGPGTFTIGLEYDPAGGTSYQPVQWCIAPTYDGSGNVMTATIPAGQTWCIAGADLKPNQDGDIVTVWQVFGHDDPRFR